ncbi:HAMP domain-containing protein [Ectothiorhodospiraceae bacterium 2226]|nr:HAMP domain-containing protein [Ectothiorhodospiraceae bacterium 2226]
MALRLLRRLFSEAGALAVLLVLLLAALWLMSAATQNSEQFSRLYSLVLGINVAALALLVGLITTNLVRLRRRYKRREPGSRLTARLVVMFVILAGAPASVLYYFSLGFLHDAIDSWYDVRIEAALDDALELSRASLGIRMRELLRQTEQLGDELSGLSDGMTAPALRGLRARSGASELSLFTAQGRAIATSSVDPLRILPSRPHETVLLQLRAGSSYVSLDPVREGDLHVRVAVAVADPGGGEARVLQALYPVSPRMNTLAEGVQNAFAQHRELVFLREPLIRSFTLTLSLVLLLSVLLAVWAAFFMARRLVAPLSDLAEGTRAVAAGNYDKRLPLSGRDDIGQLVKSFNEMTRRIAMARDEAARSQEEAEAQRTYLEAVLGHLSSGVLTVDDKGRLHTANAVAEHILACPLRQHLGLPLAQLAERYPYLGHFVEALAPHLAAAADGWREEVTLFGSGGRQVLMCRGKRLPHVGPMAGGQVVVFDDVTALIQAQRDAAWAEVARRLAHEIKNPLTPIQLSAERLRRQVLGQLDAREADILDRATHTIVAQVEAMKEMVKAFSEYANTPHMQSVPVDLNALVNEVLDLYRGDERLQILVNLDPKVPRVEADVGRLRQVLHNLVKNALEAMGRADKGRLSVSTRCMRDASCRFVELRVQDTGPGIPEAMMDRLFEPYVTSKPKGTGLGLAIVKKIVEEHGGMLWAENVAGGACIVIRLPGHSVEAGEPPAPDAQSATAVAKENR